MLNICAVLSIPSGREESEIDRSSTIILLRNLLRFFTPVATIPLILTSTRHTAYYLPPNTPRLCRREMISLCSG